MTKLEFSATIRDLHSNRYPPWGFEDAYAHEYTKEKQEIHETESKTLGFGGGETHGSARSVGKREKGRRSEPFFRFVRRKDGSVNEEALGESLESALRGALKRVASLIGDRDGFPKTRVSEALLQVSVENIGKVSPIPTRIAIPLKGFGGGLQWVFHEKLENVRISGSVVASVSAAALERGLRQVETIPFGPVRRGRVAFQRIGVLEAEAE